MAPYVLLVIVTLSVCAFSIPKYSSDWCSSWRETFEEVSDATSIHGTPNSTSSSSKETLDRDDPGDMQVELYYFRKIK